MLRAAATGVVDFKTADPCDAKWWAHCYVILTAVERDDERTLADVVYLAAASRLASSHSQEAGDVLRNAFKAAVAARRPWEGRGPAKSVDAASLQAAWEAQYGDMDAPETQAAIAATVAAMQAAVAANKGRAA